MSVVTVNHIKGLKYPDEYTVKFFFKNGLDKKTGRVLELGCSNGNNLSLFYEYGWDVTGVDISNNAIEEARGLYPKGHFFVDDIYSYSQRTRDQRFDVLLCPSSLYYMSEIEMVDTLYALKGLGYLSDDALVYFRMRDLSDHRNSTMFQHTETDRVWMDTNNSTGEANCYVSFYSHMDFVHLLKKSIGLKDYKLFTSKQTNIQNGEIILNSDFIVWGNV